MESENDPDPGKYWMEEEKGAIEDEMIECHYQLNVHEFKQTAGASGGQWSLAWSPWGHKQ